MQEVSTLLDLELVESTTEFNMFDRFLSFSVEFLCPTRFAAMDCLVQFLENAEVGAWRRAYQKIGRLLLHSVPN